MFIFVIAAIVIIAMVSGWRESDRKEAEQEAQEALRKEESAKKTPAQSQPPIAEIDAQPAGTRAIGSLLKRPSMPTLGISIAASFRHRYGVVGVTFKNADGTFRQKILKAIANHEPPYEECEVSLDEYDYKGERALAVKVNGDQIGNIARKDLDEVFGDLDIAERIVLRVYGGDKEKNYGAAITLISEDGDLDDEDLDDEDLDDEE